jgi:hypothetical protein
VWPVQNAQGRYVLLLLRLRLGRASVPVLGRGS